jgi:hypothetical protein
MSNIYKAIIPLIDESISLNDIKDDTFVDCFLEDKNRPYLDNHVFLLYEWGDKKSSKVFYNFKKAKSFYGYKIMYIDKKCYIVYAFTSNRNIRSLKGGNITLGDIIKLRILRFWQFTDKWVTFNITRGTVMCDPPSGVVPEEDYLED